MTTVVAPPPSNQLLGLNSVLAESYQAFRSAALDAGSLQPEVRAAVALAAAIAFNRAELVRAFLATAKQTGLANEDIGQVAAIVDVLRIESHQRPSASGQAEHVHQPKASKSCC